MTAALPAFLLEAVFYLGSLFESTRLWFSSLRPARWAGLLLWLSAVAPYLVFSLAAGTYRTNAFEILALLTGILAFWFLLMPRRWPYDAGFLILAAAPILLRVLPRLYVSPDPHQRIDVLGHLMWIRLAAAVLLVFREWNPGAFGLWPQAREWRAGFLYYLAAIGPIALLALSTHDVRFAIPHGAWWQVVGLALGVFFGALWVIAVGEELFFRGVIASAVRQSWGSPVAAILLSAVLYGSAHLWFGTFPNWQRAVTATALGLVLGLIYIQTSSVRAAMVTHALVVASWRVFFRL